MHITHSATPYLQPMLGPISPEEFRLLTCHYLDRELFTRLDDLYYPKDLLHTPQQRATCLSSQIPAGHILVGATALWVHTGIGEPQLRTGKRAHTPRLHPAETMSIGGQRIAKLRRAVLDEARLADPVQAVRAVIIGKEHGVSHTDLYLSLGYCRGHNGFGRQRAEHIIRSVYADSVPG